MANIEQALVQLLTNPDAVPLGDTLYTKRRNAIIALNAAVGSRISPVVLPQEETLPAITYFKVSGARIHSLRGPSGLAHPRYQFDIYKDGSDGYAVCKAIAGNVRKALDGFRGIVIGVNIQSCLLENEEDPYEEEPELYRVSMDFMIMHNED